MRSLVQSSRGSTQVVRSTPCLETDPGTRRQLSGHKRPNRAGSREAPLEQIYYLDNMAVHDLNAVKA